MPNPRIWIARDQKVAVPGSDQEDDGTWIYTRRPVASKVFLSNRKEYAIKKGAPGFHIGAGELFFEDIGVVLKPGECKEFRLVEVKK